MQIRPSFYAFDMPRYDIWYPSEVKDYSNELSIIEGRAQIPNLSETFFECFLVILNLSFPITALHSWQKSKLIILHNTNHCKEPELYLTLLLDCVLNEDKDLL